MIEVNGIIYRNLEEQVQKNKEDIESLQNKQSGDDVNIEQINNRLIEVETNITELTPDVARALKTPMSAPATTKLVAVDTTNSQEMITIGENLTLENGVLNAIGGGGSGGTSDYNDLTNKPQINNITLSGNKSLSELGINLPQVIRLPKGV